MTRVMPKEMQITCLKRLFPIWNKWRAEASRSSANIYDVFAEMDNVDWDIIEYGANFRENLEMLKNNYPEYSWSSSDNPEKMLEQSQTGQEEDTEAIRLQHEAFYEAEQQKDIPIPEDSETEADPEKPLGVWEVEKTASGEIRTIQVEIIPHPVKSKGKVYTFGRIQLTVPRDLLGYRAKISVFVPEIH